MQNYWNLWEKNGTKLADDEETEEVRKSFLSFSSIYHANAAARNEGEVLSAGDAFLIYLGIFSYEEAISKPASKSSGRNS